MRATWVAILAVMLAPAVAGASTVYVQAGSLAPGAPPSSAWRGTPPSAPPAPRIERVRPRRGWIWIQGNYEWRDRRYVWIPGHWERERPGQRWHGGHWEWQGDHHAWVGGNWASEHAHVAPPDVAIVAQPQPLPPPPQQLVAPPPARPGFLWVAGHHEWRDGRYVWEEGHWERERAGERWEPGHWDGAGGRHYWHPSGWHRAERGG